MLTRENIEIIHQIQLNTIIPFRELNTFLTTKQRGLYWIWTDYSFNELSLMDYEPQPKSRHINIRELIQQRKELDFVCKVKQDNKIILYNGIGGFRNSLIPAFGLRERIRQEFNCKDPRTGTLNLVNTSLDTNRFYVSFFNFDEMKYQKLFPFLQNDDAYVTYASELEKLWRLQFGHPILCRH